MTDEDKKRIVSEPPPPTDEIDGEWGDDDETLVRDAPSLTDPPKVSVRPSAPAASSPPAATPASAKPQAAAPAETAAAPIADPPVAAAAEEEGEDEEEDEDEESEEETDEEEDEDEEDEEASAQPAHASTVGRGGQDWIPEWGPFAVLGLLVCVSILVGLGVLGGGAAPAEEESAEKAAPAPSALKAATKPSPH